MLNIKVTKVIIIISGIRKEEIKAFNGNFKSGFVSEMYKIATKISRGKRKGNI
jgi:hypothetical protein